MPTETVLPGHFQDQIQSRASPFYHEAQEGFPYPTLRLCQCAEQDPVKLRGDPDPNLHLWY